MRPEQLAKLPLQDPHLLLVGRGHHSHRHHNTPPHVPSPTQHISAMLWQNLPACISLMSGRPVLLYALQADVSDESYRSIMRESRQEVGIVH